MTETLKLPVLPLTDSVLLPGMVIPVRLDEPEISAAVDAAQSQSDSGVDRKVLVVPRLDGRYAAVGTVAVLEQVGRLPSGEKAAVVRGEVRARIGSGVTGPGAALWVEVEPITDPAPTGRVLELAKEYKALVVSILQQRGAWQVIDNVERTTDPGALADLAGWAPYFDDAQKAQLLAETDVAKRLAELLIGWTKEHVAEQEISEKIGKDVREGVEKPAAGVPAAPAARGDPQGARRGRAGGLGRLPGPRRGREPARARAQGRAQGGRQARAQLGAEPRGRVDPHLAGHRPRHPVERPHRRQRRPRRRPRGARRGPRGARRRQGTADRVPGRPRAAQPPRAGEGRRPRVRCRDGPGRAARRRQDVAGRVGRPGAGPQVRPRRPRRRA